jgi:formylmethanofuran dehydrogenase subunit E
MSNHKEHVHQMVTVIQRAANSIPGLDPDIHERLDEVVLSIYDQFDVTFQRCSCCEEDVLVELLVDHKGPPYCKECFRERELANADYSIVDK